MPQSVVAICNNALIMLGEETITALNDQTKAARLCNQRWDSVRDAVLRDHEWACVSTDAALAASASPPVSAWDFAYPLPPDFVRAIRVSTLDGVEITSWEIVGRNLLCNEKAPVILRYVQSTNQATLFDPLLSEALAARLALELCQSMVGSSSLMDAMAKLYQDKLRTARGVNARDVQPRTLQDSAWRKAKLGG
jgi:hypothetical protein